MSPLRLKTTPAPSPSVFWPKPKMPLLWVEEVVMSTTPGPVLRYRALTDMPRVGDTDADWAVLPSGRTVVTVRVELPPLATISATIAPATAPAIRGSRRRKAFIVASVDRRSLPPCAYLSNQSFQLRQMRLRVT